MRYQTVRHFTVVIALSCFLCGLNLSATEAVDFQRDVFPILKTNCFDCHGPDSQEGQLRLDAKLPAIRGGVSGPAIVGGKPDASLLLKRLVTDDTDQRMPLDEEPLNAEQIEVIRRWIELGARWPDGVGTAVDAEQKHWAYIPPKRAALPEVANAGWCQTPIDYFVLARLQQEGLVPSKRAKRAKLLRRVYLDLIGIPPAVEELDDFLNDQNPDAFERVVDRLLAMPQYGERWARPWLDAARYADSNGYQADQYRNVWPYRDWVIRAMNDDMPFDQFTIEQLAGDLLPNATLDQKVATGFQRLTTCNVEAGVDPEENRTNQIIDRVNTTGTVWLGTTVECMQCHSHKYDPFTQKEYYELFAYFNNTPLEVEGNGVTYNFVGPKMDLPLSEAKRTRRAELQQRHDEIKARLDQLIAARTEKLDGWEHDVKSVRKDEPQWHVLHVESFNSVEGATREVLPDESILIGGNKPDKDIYTITVTTDIKKSITGFKLEALTHDSLPGRGPGRYERPNFVLYEFEVTSSSISSPAASSSRAAAPTRAEPVQLQSASADFSQKGWDAAGAIDGKSDTGWAINPQFGKDHYAVFLTTKPLGADGQTRLSFSLDQHYGGGRTIGRLRLSAMTGNPGNSAVPAAIAKILDTAKAKRTKQQRKQLLDHFLSLDPQIKASKGELVRLTKDLDAIKPTTTLVMIEKERPRMTSVFKRGQFLNKGNPVQPGTPRALHHPDAELPPNRMGLALWLTDKDNPLTARVIVNRWWAEIFGQGIVATIEDFGTQGEPPTHPKLLDWLACEFMDSGWSMKHVHKQIVMSAMYQQSSAVSQQLLKLDPANKLYARGPRLRLAAETLRDNALAVAGLLSKDMAGEPIFPPQPDGVWRHVGRNAPKYNTSTGNDRFRRGIYVIWRRSAPYPSFTNFDAPDRASCVVKRPRTNTPLQALTLMNDQAYVEMALSLAGRMAGDRPKITIDEKIKYGFRLCTSREPKEVELETLEDLYNSELQRFEQDPKSAEALADAAWRGEVEVTEFAAWFFVANVLLNLDETITKS